VLLNDLWLDTPDDVAVKTPVGSVPSVSLEDFLHVGGGEIQLWRWRLSGVGGILPHIQQGFYCPPQNGLLPVRAKILGSYQ